MHRTPSCSRLSRASAQPHQPAYASLRSQIKAPFPVCHPAADHQKPSSVRTVLPRQCGSHPPTAAARSVRSSGCPSHSGLSFPVSIRICFREAAPLSHTVLIGILYIMFFYLSTVFTDSYIKNLRLTFPHHSAIVIVKQRANARNRTRFPDSPHHREPSVGVRRYAISETILCEQCTEPSRCYRDSPVTGKLIAAGLRPQR